MVESYFDGNIFELIFIRVLIIIVTLGTFGILYPWAMCKAYSWEAKHTVINGRRLMFSGTPLELMGNWIKWLFLSIITFGIYSVRSYISLKKWKIKHTHFDTI